MNLLIILAVLGIALIVLIPLIEKTAKPVDEEQLGKYSKIFMGLLALLMLLSSIKFCTGM